jgi:hypothetical protein
VYVAEDHESVTIEREVINLALGYKESFWPRRFWRVSDGRPVCSVVQRFDI